MEPPILAVDHQSVAAAHTTNSRCDSHILVRDVSTAASSFCYIISSILSIPFSCAAASNSFALDFHHQRPRPHRGNREDESQVWHMYREPAAGNGEYNTHYWMYNVSDGYDDWLIRAPSLFFVLLLKIKDVAPWPQQQFESVIYGRADGI